MGKNVLLISGGGSYGSWGGGLASVVCKNVDYDTIIGTSTGALLAPLIALKKFNKLKEIYTSVSQEDIFNVNPFTKKGGISIINAIIRLFQNKTTLGESENLKFLIYNLFTEKEFNEILNKKINLIVCVHNITLGRTEYKSIMDYNYFDFCNFIWASANSPFFMSILEYKGNLYIDGGLQEHIPASYIKSFLNDIDRLDIIIHRTKEKKSNVKIDSLLDNIIYSMESLSVEVSRNDLYELKCLSPKQLNIYYMKKEPDFKSLLFNKNKMLDLWEDGENLVANISHSIY